MTAASGQVELVGGPRKADLGSKSSGATADESEQVPRRGHFGKRPDSLVITLLQSSAAASGKIRMPGVPPFLLGKLWARCWTSSPRVAWSQQQGVCLQHVASW